MPLSPADVHNVAFSKPPIGKRGYNEDEVDQFLDLVEDTEPPVWIVEVFNAEGSMGDGVADMREGPEGLVACDPEGFAEILGLPPNVDVTA